MRAKVRAELKKRCHQKELFSEIGVSIVKKGSYMTSYDISHSKDMKNLKKIGQNLKNMVDD